MTYTGSSLSSLFNHTRCFCLQRFRFVPINQCKLTYHTDYVESMRELDKRTRVIGIDASTHQLPKFRGLSSERTERKIITSCWSFMGFYMPFFFNHISHLQYQIKVRIKCLYLLSALSFPQGTRDFSVSPSHCDGSR